MIDLRGGVLAVTICVVIALINDQPRPVKDNQVKYCVIDYQALARHPLTGEMVKVWTKGFGPCALQDIFREI